MGSDSGTNDVQSTRQDAEQDIDFCTLGMFIIDEIHFPPPKDPVYNILGGAGSYSALGARLLSPPPLSRSVGWIVDAGSDFPVELREEINRWRTSCVFRETPDRLTTRAWNGYMENEYRAFKYLTEKIRLDHTSLSPRLLKSKSFHLICSPARCIDLVENILKLRNTSEELPRPIFVWEPVPDLCLPSELENCRKALQVVDVVSPNHQELAAFWDKSGNTSIGDVDRPLVEELTQDWLSSTIGTDLGGSRIGGVVIRAGKDGCYVASQNTTGRWIPPYHRSAERVVDPTGGGNTFLGGLIVALTRGESLIEASIMAGVSASFAIEQVGMPTLAYETDGSETWNGIRVADRLTELQQWLEL
ncbi:Ribokinase-like protein [Eremomyces bilateralis CBS 781.70]|uniref:Ribokinase-like protein n=1 Tax=Eremomyces bilateralis CBS 781.70 TaxID=1392243 RepID=A0A6G1G160_9PEZI|nr:Ribokinase-like protein [Eremomyces bilateralis CBS 781.70]KAF1811773.1 Ribokinase-like protein [Eremomyces bilateralis CBS 781.70]